MIKSLRQARITDGLPRVLARQEWVIALSEALGLALGKTLDYTDESQIYTRLDTAPETVLDVLAVDWKIDWYDTELTVEQKRRIVKTALTVRRLMGTAAAVKLQVHAIYPEATVTEWFQYDGKPGCFRVSLPLPKEGITVESCIIGEWKKDVGDSVNVGDVLFSYETDKAEFDCESTAAGTLLAKFYEDGDEVPCLANVCAIGNPGDAFEFLKPGAEVPAPAAAPAAEEAAPAAVAAPAAAVDGVAAKPADWATARISTLEENEREHIARALQYAGGRISGPRGAAALLGDAGADTGAGNLLQLVHHDTGEGLLAQRPVALGRQVGIDIGLVHVLAADGGVDRDHFGPGLQLARHLLHDGVGLAQGRAGRQLHLEGGAGRVAGRGQHGGLPLAAGG